MLLLECVASCSSSHSHYVVFRSIIFDAIMTHVDFTDCTKIVDPKKECLGYGFSSSNF